MEYYAKAAESLAEQALAEPITAAFEEVWTRRGDTVQALMHGNPRRPPTGATRSFLV